MLAQDIPVWPQGRGLQIAQRGVRDDVWEWGQLRECLAGQKFWNHSQTRPLHLQVGKGAEMKWLRGGNWRACLVRPRHLPMREI